MPVLRSWFGCRAHISPHLIVRTSLSRVGMIFFRRQWHNNYAVYWLFKALSRHKSFDWKRRYCEYCLLYTAQACKFVAARFCYRANWSRVGTRITFLIQTSVCYTKRKRKRSDSVIWQKPLHQQKCQKGKVTTQTTPQKSSIKQRLRTDLGRSVGVTTATQLVWLTGLRAHLPTNRNSR